MGVPGDTLAVVLATSSDGQRYVGRHGLRSGRLAVVQTPGAFSPTSAERSRHIDLRTDLVDGDGELVDLIRGEPPWFVLCRVIGDDNIAEVRSADDPGTVHAAIELGPDRSDARVTGESAAWQAVGPVICFGDHQSLEPRPVVRVDAGTPHRVDLPAGSAWEHHTARLEEYGLKVQPIPGQAQLAIQSAHSGHRFDVWDLDRSEVIARVDYNGPYPIELPRGPWTHSTVWVASFDTMFEFEHADWSQRSAVRLRNEETGCFVSWIEQASHEHAIVGWHRRRPLESWDVAVPRRGDIVSWRLGELEAETIATFPSWASEAVVDAGNDGVVAHTGVDQYLWTGRTTEPLELHEPRPEETRIWL